MRADLHLNNLILTVDHFHDILPDTIEEELVLLLLDSGDGQFAEYLVDGLELA